MRALVTGYPNEAEQRSDNAAVVFGFSSHAPSDFQETPFAAESLQRRPVVWVCTGRGADHCIFNGAALEHRAAGAIMTRQNASPSDDVLGYGRMPERDQANAKRSVFFR
jgi:hypothetical protein